MAVELRTLDDSDPLLGGSKLLDAVRKSVGFAKEHGGIGLTKGKAFNRKFATWAAENFNWPEYSADQLLRIQKVLNEEDVLPVLALHKLMISMKLGRHVKDSWRFSNRAQALAETPGALQLELTKGFLFEFDHSRLQRSPFVAPGNWDIWLNVINVEAHSGVSEAALLKTFYGVEYSGAGDREFWDHASFLMWHVLKPLTWLGYLTETELDRKHSPLDRTIFAKTPLWRRTFRLDTDDDLRPHLVH
ncbi:hypothetical protein K3553_04330 [Leisingera aquaemixtae]|uniref:hypothetical protein n=1 Tax=Leisingera aquaemixtae TaxID=1396826 RepID=UPI0021A6F67C|nr:hypothetical protein [Leisingera aquaemixtae]UWQ25695.1 hypothetical protein K3553_04330 [Leisingera aquaemixtae]